MSFADKIEKFKQTEVGYSLSLFAQKEVIIIMLLLVLFLAFAGLAA